jgi:hypothetical protein
LVHAIAEALMTARLQLVHDSWKRGLNECPGLTSVTFTAKHRALLLDELLRLQVNLEKGEEQTLHAFWLSGASPSAGPGARLREDDTEVRESRASQSEISAAALVAPGKDQQVATNMLLNPHVTTAHRLTTRNLPVRELSYMLSRLLLRSHNPLLTVLGRLSAAI